MTPEKGRRLGRGLEALIPTGARGEDSKPDSAGELLRLPLAQIRPNPFQPRRTFQEAELAELQASIGASGLLQPVTVRRRIGGYELISGERRLRAVGRLGWTEIPAVVKEVDDQTLLTLALIENLQRADLTPIEEAIGYKRLIEEFGFTQQAVAEAIGKDRTTITNLLRILTLPDSVQGLVAGGQLSAGHARALLVLTRPQDVQRLANEAIAGQLSVRELERRARLTESGELDPRKPRANVSGAAGVGAGTPASNAMARQIADDLRRHFQTDTRVKLTGDEKGTIELDFYSADDLERLLDILLGASRQRL